MKRTIHRSENLAISIPDDDNKLEVEIRFTSSSAKGHCDRTCPRCGTGGEPAHWEIEGPDGANNTMWLSCPNKDDCPGNRRDDGYTWMRDVTFEEWVEFD